jgi:hypothetical protein
LRWGGLVWCPGPPAIGVMLIAIAPVLGISIMIRVMDRDPDVIVPSRAPPRRGPLSIGRVFPVLPILAFVTPRHAPPNQGFRIISFSGGPLRSPWARAHRQMSVIIFEPAMNVPTMAPRFVKAVTMSILNTLLW